MQRATYRANSAARFVVGQYWHGNAGLSRGKGVGDAGKGCGMNVIHAGYGSIPRDAGSARILRDFSFFSLFSRFVHLVGLGTRDFALG